VITHPKFPGQVLLEDFLIPRGMSQAALARSFKCTPQYITRLVKGQASVGKKTAEKLAKRFQTTVSFWLDLQYAYRIAELKAQEAQAEVIIPLMKAGL
jgi:addiction module HigA family antidote